MRRTPVEDGNDMKLTRSQTRYLVEIHKLSGREGVRSVGIAEALGVSRPSVSRMLNNLTQLGLLEKNPEGIVLLTDVGRELAENRSRELKRLSVKLCETLTVSMALAEECALLLISELPQGV